MRRLTQVEFHHSPFPSSFLQERGNWTPLTRLTKAATTGVKVYSEALAKGEPVEAQTNWVRFVLVEGAPEFAPRGIPATPSLGMGEVHDIPAPPLTWLDLPDSERRSRLVDYLHAHVLVLAEALGWNRLPLDTARRAAEEASHRFRLTSRSKASPDRKHTARLEMEIDGAGDAWLTVCVARRVGDGEDRQVARLPTGERVRDFNACVRTWRWTDSTTLVLNPWPLWPPAPGFSGDRAISIEER